jgi:cell division septal protein FtsQ
MLQQTVRKFKWLGILFLFTALTTFNLTSSNFINFFFPIKFIKYNKTIFLKETTKSKANNFLRNKSLIWINTKKANNLFNKNTWIESVIFTKKFPDTLEVSILEYSPIAYFKKNKLTYLISSNFDNFLVSNNSFLVGLMEVKNIKNMTNFKIFFLKIKNYDIFFSRIKVIDNVYEGRWNVILKSGQLIKLGNYNLDKQVKYINFLLNNKAATIIDLRYEGRAIVINE